MVVSWGDSVRIVRCFTGDLEELDRTLDAVARRSPVSTRRRRSWTSSRRATSGCVRRRGDGRKLRVRRLGPRTSPGTSRRPPGVGALKAKTAALRGLVALMAGMEGRKSLVVVSHHFGRHPGGEYSRREARRARLRRLAPRAGQPASPSGQLATRRMRAAVTLLRRLSPTIYDMRTLPSAAESWATSNPRIDQRPPRSPAATRSGWTGSGGSTSSPSRPVASRPATRVSCPSFLERVERDLDSFYSIGFPAAGGTRSCGGWRSA